VNVRPIAHADAEAVAEIAAADEEALRGRPSHIRADDVRSWWTGADLAQASWLFEEDSAVLAVGWFQIWGEIGAGVGVVALGAKGRGLGGTIADRVEACGRAHEVKLLHTFVLPEDAAARALFGARGFREVRRFYEMAIELTGPPPPSVVPDGLVLDAFREDDAVAFHSATGDAFSENWDFRTMPFEEWWQMRRGHDADERGPLWFVVRDGDELAATIRTEARSAGGFIATLGVRRPWRGRGLARALLHRSFDEFWRRGLTRVTLGVDSENPTGATHLYESVGMKVESSMLTFEKVLG